MKVNQKSVVDNLVTLDVVASAEEVDRAFFNCSVVFAQQNGLQPQPGKTPAQVAQEQLGIADLDAIVAPNVIEYLAPFAVDKKDLVPEFLPVAKPKSALERGKEFAFELPVSVKPSYTLTSYEPVVIELKKFNENAQAIDEQIAALAEQFAEYQDDEPHVIAEGDACAITMKASAHGEPMPALDMEKRTYVTGQGYMPESFDENIIGMNVGETKTFTFSVAEIDPSENQDETIECTVTIDAAQKKVLPTIDDEWVKQFFPMFESLEDLRNDIAEKLLAQNKAQYEQYSRGAAAEALVERFEGSISDGAYESMAATLTSNMQAQIAQQGITWDKFVEMQGGSQQFNIMLMMQVRKILVQGYCLDSVYQHEKLVATEEDIMEACATLNPENPEAIRQQMEGTGRGFALREVAERLCASKYVLKNAQISYKDE